MSTIEKSNDFYLNIARRLVSNSSAIMRFGRNPNINISDQDVWGVGGTWLPPTAARLHNIKSSNANDTALGTGARTVVIVGLDADYAVQTETISMNGVTNVPTVNTYTMINRMYVATAGDGLTNAGNISATAAVDLTVTAQINTGYGEALQAIYQVPAGNNSYLIDLNLSALSESTAVLNIDLLVKPFGGAWLTVYGVHLISTGNSADKVKFSVPPVFTAKSIVKLRCHSNANNTDLSGSFTLVNLETDT